MRVNSFGNVAINTIGSSGNTKLQVNGDASFSGSVTANTLVKSGGTATQFLMADGSVTNLSAVTSGLNYNLTSGTTNTLPKFLSGNTVANSRFTDTGLIGEYIGNSGGFFGLKFGDLGSNQVINISRNGNESIVYTLGASPSQANQITSNNTNSLSLETKGALSLKVGSAFTEGLRVNQFGNTGIGTTGATGTGTTRLEVSGNTKIIGILSATSVVIGSATSLHESARITANIGTTIVYSIPTSAYTGTFIDYTVNNGLNLRAGNIMSVFNASNIRFTETSTLDIGNTSGITFSMIISGSNAALQASAVTSGWDIKSIIRSI
jgi:hypothetical protein